MNYLHSIIRVAIVTLALLAIPVFGDTPSYTYLALGDSISFGYSPRVMPVFAANYTGFPEIVAADLNLLEADASCPGQTSGSFLTGAPDNGCENNGSALGYKSAFGLHAAYTGTQMNFAVSQLQADKNINLVTLSIGGNDLLLLQQSCSDPSNPASSDFAQCVKDNLPGVLYTYGGYLTQILTTIRGVYKGNLVLSEYASPSADPIYMQAVAALNSVMVQVGEGFGPVGFADGFAAFQAATGGGDPCAAGLLVPLPGGGCDVHPTYAGQQLLATAVLDAVNSLPAPKGSTCSYTGGFTGNLTVRAGQNCLVVDGTVAGNVTLNGGTLALSNAMITGDVQVQNGGAIAIRAGSVIGGNLAIQNVPGATVAPSQVCGSTVEGNVTVQNNGIPVAIGSNSPLCPGNVITGNVVSQNNSASSVLLHNTVHGNLQDQNNRGQTEVFNNGVVNNLQCQNNSVIAGGWNTARQKQGQCASY